MSGTVAKRVLYALIAFGLIGIIGGISFAALGYVRISARDPHSQIGTFVLHQTFKASVRRKAEESPPAPDLSDAGLIALGAQHYGQVCSSCHGGPGLGQSPQALSLRPRPQSLPAVVDQFTDAELYQILLDGVRFSAMPSWPADANFEEIWSVVAFLRQLPGMDASRYAELAAVDLSLSADDQDRPTSQSGAGTAQPNAAGNGPEDAQAAGAGTFAWQERGELHSLDLHAMAPPMDEFLYAAPGTGWRPIGLNGAPLGYCAACHGADGTGEVTGGHAPNLSIQSEEFISRRLTDYATGRQPSGIMAVAASSLSNSQIAALAAHYASLPDASMGPGPGAQAAAGAGEDLVTTGNFDVALPACGQCHGKAARDVMPMIPAIAGQNEPFLQSRLRSYEEDPADNEAVGWNPMHELAAKLNPEERQAVASHLAGLQGSDRLEPAELEVDPQTADFVQRECASCHTTDLVGSRRSAVPDLTLQSAAYIKQQLALFRLEEVPEDEAEQITAHRQEEADVDRIAAYIGNLAAAPAPDFREWEASSEESLEQARMLAEEGDPERGLPACLGCHGAATDGVRLLPRLSGQKPFYLLSRLDHFAGDGPYRATSANPMHEIAEVLSDEEREALADYFARQAPRAKPGATSAPG